MTRLPIVIFAALFLPGTPAVKQPLIVLPNAHYAVHEQIRARIENMNDQPISICVEYGQWSMKDGKLETTPLPFIVQRKLGSKWSALLIGPDVGSNRHSRVLDPKESAEFPFRLNDGGDIRLVLEYWPGSKGDWICGPDPKGGKRATSTTFLVR
jgi:hypothetical protein